VHVQCTSVFRRALSPTVCRRYPQDEGRYLAIFSTIAHASEQAWARPVLLKQNQQKSAVRVPAGSGFLLFGLVSRPQPRPSAPSA
jgi:hypothetical protein